MRKLLVLLLVSMLFGCDQADQGSAVTETHEDVSVEMEVAVQPGEDAQLEEIIEIQCSFDLDCNDDNWCTSDHCVDGFCVSTNDDGKKCNDNDSATIVDVCTDGLCRGTWAECLSDKVCDDDNPCTDESCEDSKCVYVNTFATLCNDNNPMTINDYCASGFCQGTLVECVLDSQCDDDNSCTTDHCDLDMHKCIFTAKTELNLLCNDNNEQTVDDICVDGICQGTKIICSYDIQCDDKNSCTENYCIDNKCEKIGKTGNSCNDDNADTINDICVEGVCLGIVGNCNSNYECDDDNVCTQEACVDNSCEYVNVDLPCSDNNDYTFNDMCLNGVCLGEYECQINSDCDDENVCTNDECEEFVCVHKYNTVWCDDGFASTVLDKCSYGNCKGQIPQCLNDSDCFNDNSCSTVSCGYNYICVFNEFPGIDCDDDNAETVHDMCIWSNISWTTLCLGQPIKECWSDIECPPHAVCADDGYCESEKLSCYSSDDCYDGLEVTSDYCRNGFCTWELQEWMGDEFCLEDKDCDDDDSETTDWCGKDAVCQNIIDVEKGTLKVEMKTDGFESSADSYFITGLDETTRQAGKYLAEIVLTAKIENASLEELSFENVGDNQVVDNSLFFLALSDEDQNELATAIAQEIDGKMVWRFYDFGGTSLHVSQGPSLTLYLKIKSVVDGSITCPDYHGQTFQAVISDVVARGEDSSEYLDTIADADGILEDNEWSANYSKTQTLTSVAVTVVQNKMPDDMLVAGWESIAKYEVCVTGNSSGYLNSMKISFNKSSDVELLGFSLNSNFEMLATPTVIEGGNSGQTSGSVIFNSLNIPIQGGECETFWLYSNVVAFGVGQFLQTSIKDLDGQETDDVHFNDCDEAGTLLPYEKIMIDYFSVTGATLVN